MLSYGSHACGIFAAAIAFFGVLSIFPLLLLLISIFARVVNQPEATSIVVSNLSAFFPGSSDLLASAVDAVTPAEPTFAGLGAAGLLWSSMGVFMTLGYALNRVWNVQRNRHILVQYAISAGLALSVGLVALVSLGLSAIVDLSHFVRGLLPGLAIPGLGWAALAASNAITFVIVVAVVALLYRWLPYTAVNWGDVFVPAMVVALLGTAAKFGFAWYLSTVAHFNRMYGPVAAVAGLMLWMFLAGILVLFGAELSCQLAAGRSDEPARSTI
ncbi:MAG TPA: YihY/virulence factor BrkB family protein [Chloroflexota bacterium]|nr:YihY/virulence factor BrkB family protein [Chloroflexota bacterium]